MLEDLTAEAYTPTVEEAQELLLHAPGIVHPQQEEELLELHIEEPQVGQGVLEVLGDRTCPVGDPGGEGETCQVRLHGLHRCRAKVLDGTLGALSCTEVYAGEEVKGEIGTKTISPASVRVVGCWVLSRSSARPPRRKSR